MDKSKQYVIDGLVFCGIGASSFFLMGQAAQLIGATSSLIYVIHGYLWCLTFKWYKRK